MYGHLHFFLVEANLDLNIVLINEALSLSNIMSVLPNQHWNTTSVMVRNWRHWPRHQKALYKHNTRIRRLHFTLVSRQTYCALPNTHPLIFTIIVSYCSVISYLSWAPRKKKVKNNHTRGVISYLFNSGRGLIRCLPRLHTQSTRTGVTSLHPSIYVSRQNKWSTVTFLTRRALSRSLFLFYTHTHT